MRPQQPRHRSWFFCKRTGDKCYFICICLCFATRRKSAAKNTNVWLSKQAQLGYNLDEKSYRTDCVYQSQDKHICIHICICFAIGVRHYGCDPTLGSIPHRKCNPAQCDLSIPDTDRIFFEKGQMASAISYAYAHVLQLVEKVPPKILTPISLNDLRHPRDFNIDLYT